MHFIWWSAEYELHNMNLALWGSHYEAHNPNQSLAVTCSRPPNQTRALSHSLSNFWRFKPKRLNQCLTIKHFNACHPNKRILIVRFLHAILRFFRAWKFQWFYERRSGRAMPCTVPCTVYIVHYATCVPYNVHHTLFPIHKVPHYHCSMPKATAHTRCDGLHKSQIKILL